MKDLALVLTVILTACKPIPTTQESEKANAPSSEPMTSIRTFVPTEGTKDIPAVEGLVRARNDQRKADVRDIAQGITNYALDHGGEFPAGLIDGQAREICRQGRTDCGSYLKLDALAPDYLLNIPEDPLLLQDKNSKGTGYAVKAAGGRITVTSLQAEDMQINISM